MLQNMEVMIPTTLNEAITLLRDTALSVPVAGATELVPSLLAGKKSAKALISLDKLNLGGISSSRDAVELGAMTTMSQLITSSELTAGPLSLLRQALSQVGSWQIRNVATIGGSLASGIPGLDTTTALLALDASVCLAGSRGCRTVPASSFYPAPMKTALQKDELIVSILLPGHAEGDWRIWFHKAGIRKAYSLPIVNMASALLMENGVIRSWRLAAGGASRTSLVLSHTTGLAVGKRPEDVDPGQLERCLQEEISPGDSIHGSAEYKRVLCRNLLREAWADGTKARKLRYEDSICSK